MEDYPAPDPEELRKYDERRNKELSRKRKNRLGHIQDHLIRVLREISPGALEEFDLKYELMTKYSGKGDSPYSSSGKVSIQHSPAYQFVLTRKDDPSDKYQIMHLLKPDVDRNVKVADIPQHYQIEGLGKDNIPKGIEKLRKKGKGGLESTLGITSVILVFGSLFFLSANFTGFTIANLPKSYSNLIGALFFIIGLVFMFFYIGKK